jgi:predicted O-linked N-acetylglucosamine transferase (SPINDLY family)
MSAIDLLSQGLPSITTEGAAMRCRQTAVLLRRLQASEQIANDGDNHFALAVALAGDPARLGAPRSRLLAKRERLLGTPEPSRRWPIS